MIDMHIPRVLKASELNETMTNEIQELPCYARRANNFIKFTNLFALFLEEV